MAETDGYIILVEPYPHEDEVVALQLAYAESKEQASGKVGGDRKHLSNQISVGQLNRRPRDFGVNILYSHVDLLLNLSQVFRLSGLKSNFHLFFKLLIIIALYGLLKCLAR